MLSRTKIKLFFFFQLITLTVNAQLVNSKHYSTEDGLADNRVTVIRKDRDGFMWFGSWSGISRFDGYQFTTFKSYPGDNSPLKSNRIDEILEDGAGLHLWLGAYDQRIYRFDKRTGSFLSLAQLLGDKSIENIAFSKILAVGRKTAWFKTQNEGLIFLNNSSTDQPKATRFSVRSLLKTQLSSNNLHHFHLDINNNAWLTFTNGVNVLTLNKSGEYTVKKITELERTNVTDLAEGKNMMLLGTSDGKLIKMDLMANIINTSSVSESGINSIIESRKSGNIYCTTAAGELIAVDGRNNARVIFNSADSSPLGYIFEDSTGVLWVGSQRDGVVRFDPNTQKATYFFTGKTFQILPGNKNFSAFEDRKGTIYLNFDGQISYYNPDKKAMSLLSSQLLNYPRSKNFVRFLYDESGVLWLSSGYDGIDKLVFQDNPFTRILPRPEARERESNEVRGIFTDQQNRLWIGTKKGEIFVYPNGKSRPTTYLNSLTNDAGVYAIHGDQRASIWLATKGKGLFQGALSWKSGEAATLTNYKKLEQDRNSIGSNSIYYILEDKLGKIWAGSYGDGLILIETLQGKTTFKTVNNSFKNYPANSFRKVRHLAQDKNGLIWVATTDGLMIFDPNSSAPENYQFKLYKKEPGNIKSLGGNDIQFIYPDSKGRVWVLTTTGGLNLAVGDRPLNSLSFINYSTKNGLPSDFLLSCIEDNQHNLWIATQNGLSKLSDRQHKFQNFGASDGLGDLSFSESSVTKMRNGTLVFGTTAGVLSFQPENTGSAKISAPLVFTNLQINSENVMPGNGSPLKYLINHTEKIELDHDQNIISLDFAVLDFHAPNKQTYACRLLGYDEVWRSTDGQRRMTYTKLPPGKYIFEVKSLNDELYKKVPFRSLAIVVHPPLWRTWWAYLTYVLLILGAVVLLRRNALTVFKLKQRVAVEQQVAELKVDFFNQISHELRTPLTMIISPSEEIQEHEKLSDKGNEYIAIVLANAKRMLHLVNQVLNLRKIQSGKDSLHPAELEVMAVVKNLIFSFKETIDRQLLNVTIHSEFPEIHGWVDKAKFEIIVYNLIGNAIKFSDDGGRIDIYVEKTPPKGTFVFKVSDQGSGVAEDELSRIFELYFEGGKRPSNGVKGTGIGLALSKELVQLHGGSISASHNLPKGLTVSVELELFTAEEESGFDNAIDQTAITNGDQEQFADDKGNELPLLLIVEDNDDMRKFLKRKFSELYKVETAGDGEEGLVKAKSLLPSLVLSDIMMPKKDGIALLDELKNDPVTSHIPVVLLSAKFSIESQIEGLKYGADYYFPKPFDLTLLTTAIGNILKQRQHLFEKLQNKEQLSEDDIGITLYDKQFLDKLLHIVEARMNDADFNIDDVSESLGMSRSAFYRKFKSLTDTTPIDFVRDTRLRKAKEILDNGEDNISVVAYSVGFNSPKYFTLCFKSKYQTTPSEYLKSVRKKRNK